MNGSDLNGSELEAATEALYAAFQVEKPGWFRREDWFVFNADEEQILVQEPLRSLKADTLNSYLFDYFDCFDYLEDPESRKHLLYLLPRVLELAPPDGRAIDDTFTFTLIEHVKLLLTSTQVEAIARFLDAWWISALDQPDDWYFTEQLFKHAPDQREWLNFWTLNTSFNATVLLATLILSSTVRWTVPYGSERHNGGLRAWLDEPRIGQRLEAALLAYLDGPDATELSDALTLWRGHVLGIWGRDDLNGSELNRFELESATETLYEAFRVPKPAELDHGPFSIQASEAQFLLREPLRELHADILRSYLFGADEQLLYFLPRLLDLAVAGQLDAEMVLERVERVQTGLTSYQEAALANFNRAWWLDLLGRPAPIWTVLTLLEHDQDVPARLREWRANTGTQAALHLAHVLWWELGRTQRHDHLHDWLAEAMTEQRLEHAFFANPDGPDAAELSDALTLWRGHVLGIWGSET